MKKGINLMQIKLMLIVVLFGLSTAGFSTCTPISGKVRKTNFPGCSKQICEGAFRCSYPGGNVKEELSFLFPRGGDSNCSSHDQMVGVTSYNVCDSLEHIVRGCLVSDFERLLSFASPQLPMKELSNTQSCRGTLADSHLPISSILIETYVDALIHPNQKTEECKKLFVKYISSDYYSFKFKTRPIKAGTPTSCNTDINLILDYAHKIPSGSKDKYNNMIRDYFLNAKHTTNPRIPHLKEPFNPNYRGEVDICTDKVDSALTSTLRDRSTLCYLIMNSESLTYRKLDIENVQGQVTKSPSLLISAILTGADKYMIGTLLAEGADINATYSGKTIPELLDSGTDGYFAYPPRPDLFKLFDEFRRTGTCETCHKCR